jgi:hypothetical protein
MRAWKPNKRVLILSRAAYLGSQRTGALFWSSDIYPTWEALAAPDSDRPEHDRLRHRLLGQRHRRLAACRRIRRRDQGPAARSIGCT